MAHRIDTKSAVPLLPALSNDDAGDPGFFTGGDPATGEGATIVSYSWLNSIQEEVCGVVTASGQTLDKTNNGQLLAAIKKIATDPANFSGLIKGSGNNTDGQVQSLVFSGGSDGDTSRPSVVDEAGNYHQLALASSLDNYQQAGNYVQGTGNNTDGQVKSLVFSGGAGGDRSRPSVVDEEGVYCQLLSGTAGTAAGDTPGIGLHTNHTSNRPTYGDANGWRDLALASDLQGFVQGTGNNTDGQVKSLVFSGGAGGDRSRPSVVDEAGNYYQLLLNSAFSGNLSGTGWCRLPNGLILQWMYLSPSGGTFNFPITFPNAAFAVLASNADGQGSNVDNAYAYLETNGTFFCRTKESVNDNSFSNYSCFVLAIGL